MTVKTKQPLQDGGAPEYAYHDRTAWRCAVFVGKSYGSKGYPQRYAAHVRWTLPVTSSNPLKQHLSGERFPDNDAVEWAVCAWFRQQPQEFYATGFPGTCETVGQVFKSVWRLHWKISAVCLSLSPFVSFKSRFVTYLLIYPRTFRWANQFANNLITTMFYWVQPNQLADRLIITFFYWVDSTKLAAYLSTFLKLSLPCILLNIHSYVGNSISKLQIKIATYVFELSAGNCHR